ncbi:MAG: response regulator transcription factor [Verrucomicrobiota bacterium]|jgi:DNA-binding NarL/FixJ family response regulator|nr:response regulator transcription factor [Verrucomicrobiota bacterium]
MDSAPPVAARLFLVDDHAIVRQGLAALLAREEAFTVAGEAGTYEEALARLSEVAPDCVVLDLSLRDKSGLDWIREVRRGGFTGNILVLSMHDESLYAEKALQAGAQGYVMKDQAEETLVQALQTVLCGRIYLRPTVKPLRVDAAAALEEGKASGDFAHLTARESEILYAIGDGLITREIAEKFGLSGRTVDVHRVNIRRKLGCNSLADLLVKAMEFKRGKDGALPPVSPPGP